MCILWCAGRAREDFGCSVPSLSALFPETSSGTEPRATLAASKPQKSCCLRTCRPGVTAYTANMWPHLASYVDTRDSSVVFRILPTLALAEIFLGKVTLMGVGSPNSLMIF